MAHEPDPLFQEYAPLTARALRLRLASRIERRTKLLYEAYCTSFQDWRGIFLHPDILFEAVASSYQDIYRLKFFRNVQWVDAHKKAAYTMKWIARMRPIQLHRGPPATIAMFRVNAWYAVRCGLVLLGVQSDWASDPWWKNYTGNLAYLLHYHSPSVEQLSSEMYVLQELRDRGSTPEPSL